MQTSFKIKYWALFVLCLGGSSHLRAHPPLESTPYGKIPAFTLLEKSGKGFSQSNLKGNFWVANFIFTRCQGPCPVLTQNMKVLEKSLPNNVSIVTFSVDPDYDSPKIFTEYAQSFGIKKENWYFVTGNKKEVYSLIRSGFKIGVEENSEGSAITEQFIHSTYFVLVNPEGTILGYFDGNDPFTQKQIPLAIKIATVNQERPWVLKLPALNALLNLSCAFLLGVGFQFIRAQKTVWHKYCMVSAFTLSTLFLISYLTYHYYLGSVPFLHTGAIRTFYFIVLFSHTFLAIGVLPLAILALRYAFQGNFVKHKNITHWAFPIWLYVSITGVMVYAMLYQL